MAIIQSDRNVTILAIVWKAEVSQKIEQLLANESKYVLLDQTYSGLKGLELCKHYQPNVILIDRSVDDVDSIELVRQLKESYPTVGIVMLSDVNELHWMRKAVILGVSDFVRKNLDKKLLLHAIDHAYEITQA